MPTLSFNAASHSLAIDVRRHTQVVANRDHRTWAVMAGGEHEVELFKARLEAAMVGADDPTWAARVFEAVHAELLATPPAQPFGARAAVLWVDSEGRAHVTHLGDVRVVLTTGRKLERVTKDHTLAEEYGDAHELSAAEREEIPLGRNYVRVLGHRDSKLSETRELKLGPSTRVMIATGSVYEALSDDVLAPVLTGLRLEPAATTIGAATPREPSACVLVDVSHEQTAQGPTHTAQARRGDVPGRLVIDRAFAQRAGPTTTLRLEAHVSPSRPSSRLAPDLTDEDRVQLDDLGIIRVGAHVVAGQALVGIDGRSSLRVPGHAGGTVTGVTKGRVGMSIMVKRDGKNVHELADTIGVEITSTTPLQVGACLKVDGEAMTVDAIEPLDVDVLGPREGVVAVEVLGDAEETLRVTHLLPASQDWSPANYDSAPSPVTVAALARHAKWSAWELAFIGGDLVRPPSEAVFAALRDGATFPRPERLSTTRRSVRGLQLALNGIGLELVITANSATVRPLEARTGIELDGAHFSEQLSDKTHDPFSPAFVSLGKALRHPLLHTPLEVLPVMPSAARSRAHHELYSAVLHALQHGSPERAQGALNALFASISARCDDYWSAVAAPTSSFSGRAAVVGTRINDGWLGLPIDMASVLFLPEVAYVLLGKAPPHRPARSQIFEMVPPLTVADRPDIDDVVEQLADRDDHAMAALRAVAEGRSLLLLGDKGFGSARVQLIDTDYVQLPHATKATLGGPSVYLHLPLIPEAQMECDHLGLHDNGAPAADDWLHAAIGGSFVRAAVEASRRGTPSALPGHLFGAQPEALHPGALAEVTAAREASRDEVRAQFSEA